jgi:hypothetical protein
VLKARSITSGLFSFYADQSDLQLISAADPDARTPVDITPENGIRRPNRTHPTRKWRGGVPLNLLPLGLDPKYVAELLESHSYLVPGSDGHTRSERMPGKGATERFYVIRESILEDAS